MRRPPKPDLKKSTDTPITKCVEQAIHSWLEGEATARFRVRERRQRDCQNSAGSYPPISEAFKEADARKKAVRKRGNLGGAR
jgi:hypothetical protein